MPGRFSWFAPRGEPTRKSRVPQLSDTTPTVDERTAEAAQMLLENPAYEKLMIRLRSEALAQFSTSPVGVSAMYMREEARYQLAAIDKVRDGIQAMADDLKLHYRRKSEEQQ